MKHGSFRSFVSFALFFFACSALASEPASPLLRIDWPEHWEIREPQRQGPAVHVQARERIDGATMQILDVTIIDTHAAQKPITRDSIKELASELRDAALSTAIEKTIPLRDFANGRGYYFVASDARFVAARANSFRQIIEGVMLDEGYLLNFTLLTNDAEDAATRAMLDALASVSVEEQTLSRLRRPLPKVGEVLSSPALRATSPARGEVFSVPSPFDGSTGEGWGEGVERGSRIAVGNLNKRAK